MTAQLLFQKIESKDWPPHVFLLGDEVFQLDEIYGFLKKSSQNIEFWDGETLEQSKFAEALYITGDLFGGSDHRVIVLKNLEKAPASVLETLGEYLEKGISDSTLVMQAGKVDKRKKNVQSLLKNTLPIEEPPERDKVKWQRFLEKKIQKSVELECWPLLWEQAQNKLAILWQDLQKISVYVGDKKQIQLQDVQPFFSASTSVSIFTWVDQFFEKKKKDVFVNYYKLLEDGEADLKLLSLLVRQLKILEKLDASAGNDNKSLPSLLGVPPFVVPKLVQLNRGISKSDKKKLWELFAEADSRLKLSDGDLSQWVLLPWLQK